MSVTGFTFLHKVQTRNIYTSGGNYRLSETVQAMLKCTKMSGQYKKKKMLSVTADDVIHNEDDISMCSICSKVCDNFCCCNNCIIFHLCSRYKL